MRKSKSKELNLSTFLSGINYWSHLCPDEPTLQQMINNAHSLMVYIINGYPAGCEHRIKRDMEMAVEYLTIEAELIPLDCFKQITFDLIEKVKAKYFEKYGTEVAA